MGRNKMSSDDPAGKSAGELLREMRDKWLNGPLCPKCGLTACVGTGDLGHGEFVHLSCYCGWSWEHTAPQKELT